MSARRQHLRDHIVRDHRILGNKLGNNRVPPFDYSLRPGYEEFDVRKLMVGPKTLSPAQIAILGVLAGTFGVGIPGGTLLANTHADTDTGSDAGTGFYNAHGTGSSGIPNPADSRTHDGKDGKEKNPSTPSLPTPSIPSLPLEDIVSAQPMQLQPEHVQLQPNIPQVPKPKVQPSAADDPSIYALRPGPLVMMPGFFKEVYSSYSFGLFGPEAGTEPANGFFNRYYGKVKDGARNFGNLVATGARGIYGRATSVTTPLYESRESLGYQKTFDRNKAVTDSYRIEFKDGEVIVTRNAPTPTQERDVTVLIKRDGKWQFMYGNLYGGKSTTTLNDPASGTTTDGPNTDSSNGFPVTTTTTTTSDPRTDTFERDVHDGYNVGGLIEAVELLSPGEEDLKIILQGRYGKKELENIVHTLDALHQTDDVRTELGAPFNRTTITNVTTDVSVSSDVKTITVEKDTELQVYVMKKVGDNWSLLGRFGYSRSELEGKVRTLIDKTSATLTQTDNNAPVTNTNSGTTLSKRKLGLEKDLWYMPFSFGLNIHGEKYTVTGELGYKVTDGSNPQPTKDDVSVQGYFAVKSFTNAGGIVNYIDRGVNLNLLFANNNPETYKNIARLVAEEYGLRNNLLVDEAQRGQMEDLARAQTIVDILYPSASTGTHVTGTSVFSGGKPVISADLEMLYDGGENGRVGCRLDAWLPLTSGTSTTSGAHQVVGNLSLRNENGYSPHNPGRIGGGFLTRLGKKLLTYLKGDFDFKRGRDGNRDYSVEFGIHGSR